MPEELLKVRFQDSSGEIKPLQQAKQSWQWLSYKKAYSFNPCHSCSQNKSILQFCNSWYFSLFRYFVLFRDPDFIAKAFENIEIRENIILNTDLTNLHESIFLSRIWELENIIFYMMSFIMPEELLKVRFQDSSGEIKPLQQAKQSWQWLSYKKAYSFNPCHSCSQNKSILQFYNSWYFRLFRVFRCLRNPNISVLWPSVEPAAQ